MPTIPSTRGDRRVRRLAADLKAQHRQPCARCGRRIDYDAPKGHPSSFNAGHLKSWERHPELRLDPRNLQPEHQLCNQQAGDDDPADQASALGVTSRPW